MHAIELLLPDLGITPDHDSSDITAEIAINSLFQQSLCDLFKGRMDMDTFNDILNQHGVDPYEYWDIVDDNIEAVGDAQLAQLESRESLILVPGKDF